MTAIVLRGDARNLPLPDESVDLVVTSPPYWQLRSYADDGQHYEGQIGDEATPAAYIEALLECTAEWARVLKPAGSMFIVLGDKYSERASPPGRGSNDGYTSRQDKGRRVNTTDWAPRKSLLCLPQRYMLGCIDQLGLVVRQEIIWHKPNGMPESVEDRGRRQHETILHLTRQPNYFAAMDEIREPHQMRPQRRPGGHKERPRIGVLPAHTYPASQRDEKGVDGRPLGRLPGSVWSIPTTPFAPPQRLGIEHFAAFPLELPRRCILGWSPSGICTACGEGRRPVSAATGEEGRHPGGGGTYRAMKNPGHLNTNLADASLKVRAITGYSCACPDDNLSSACHPTRPAIVLDPFGGTGSTALVANSYGRTGISIDRSNDYSRLAAWRTQDPGQRAAALQVPKPAPVPDGQMNLFGEAAS